MEYVVSLVVCFVMDSVMHHERNGFQGWIMKRTPVTAFIGITLVLLSPFSMLSNMLQLFLIVVGLIVLGLMSSATRVGGRNKSYIFTCDKLPKFLIFTFVFILFQAIFTSIYSILSLFFTREIDLFSLVYRNATQIYSLIMGIFMIACGYSMAAHLPDSRINYWINISFFVTILIGLYQVFAYNFGLPFIGRFVNDKFVGLRPTAFAIEPKYLSVYLAGVIFFIFDVVWRNRLSILFRLIYVGGLIAAVYLFILTASANGFVSIALLCLLRLFVMPIKIKISIVVLFVLLAAIFIYGFSMEDLQLRGAHMAILENITEIDLSLFDDLIALPLMAWRDNLLMTVFGYGPGMMHFFALDYMRYATWLTDETYIEGNLSIIKFISNFGFIFYCVFVGFIVFCATKILKFEQRLDQVRTMRYTLHIFFLNMFLLGAIVSANDSVPFFISIGWIMYWFQCCKNNSYELSSEICLKEKQ